MHRMSMTQKERCLIVVFVPQGSLDANSKSSKKGKSQSSPKKYKICRIPVSNPRDKFLSVSRISIAVPVIYFPKSLWACFLRQCTKINWACKQHLPAPFTPPSYLFTKHNQRTTTKINSTPPPGTFPPIGNPVTLEVIVKENTEKHPMEHNGYRLLGSLLQ